MRAIVLADGHAPSRRALTEAWPGWDAEIELVVAADGGARLAEPLGLTIDRWVGDGDSIDADALATLRERGVATDLASHDKDESDTELALRAALAAGADDIVVLGAIGGTRIDHALANIGLLADAGLAGRTVTLLAPDARIRLLQGPGSIALAGRVGDLVSLLPFGADVEGVVTAGLQYPLGDEVLAAGPARGLSNVRIATEARVRIGRGRLLVVEIPVHSPHER
jgi:thiamine pyrophosphokinase